MDSKYLESNLQRAASRATNPQLHPTRGLSGASRTLQGPKHRRSAHKCKLRPISAPGGGAGQVSTNERRGRRRQVKDCGLASLEKERNSDVVCKFLGTLVKKVTDDYTNKIDGMIAAKEKDIMTV